MNTSKSTLVDLSGIPSDWQVLSIAEISSASARNGIFVRKENFGNGIPLINVLDLYKGLKIKTQNLDRVNISEKEIQRYGVKSGDLFFVRSSLVESGIGQCAFVTDLEEAVVFECHIIRVRPDAEKVDANYLVYACNARSSRIQILKQAKTTTMTTVSQSALEKVLVPVPLMEEQQGIVAILNEWSEAIALVEQRIEAARLRKKGLMQRLLTGRVRFPGFVKSRDYRQTKLGPIPTDWKIVRIQNVATVNRENLGSNSDPEHKYLYLELSKVDKGVITMPTQHQKFGNLPSRARRVLHKGDVIMSTVRPNLLGFALCDFEPQAMLCSTGFALLSPKDLSDSPFIYQNLYSDVISRQVHGLVTGSNYPAINTSEVKRLRLFWPRLKEERVKIAAVLQTCDREIALLEQKRDALQRQKKGLMQRLLTGRVRVSV